MITSVNLSSVIILENWNQIDFYLHQDWVCCHLWYKLWCVPSPSYNKLVCLMFLDTWPLFLRGIHQKYVSSLSQSVINSLHTELTMNIISVELWSLLQVLSGGQPRGVRPRPGGPSRSLLSVQSLWFPFCLAALCFSLSEATGGFKPLYGTGLTLPCPLSHWILYSQHLL